MAAVVGTSLHNILMDAYDSPYYQGHGGEGTSSSNYNTNASQFTHQFDAADQMELSDYEMMFDDQVGSLIMPPPLPTSSYQLHHGMNVVAPIAPIAAPAGTSNSINASALGGAARREETTRIAFRVKSEDFEVLEDGYKWRKYGKKSVKNSPNPRNYYKCSAERCLVKKRVERDREDPSYVITTYEGTHNHMSPAFVYHTSQDTTTGRFYVAGFQMPPPPGS